MLALNTLAIGAASLFAVVAADHGHLLPRSRHHNVAERSEHHLQKRFGGRATYYQTGMGACGKYNNPSDKIVALNAPQFGGGYPGPNCFKMITICKGDNCHPAQIMDMCPGCDYGALDMSQSLFEQFANTDDGVFQMTWSFNDDKPEEPKTTEKPDPPKTSKKPDPPKTTKEPEPEPTTTWEPPTTTSKKHTSTSTHETTSTPEPTTSTSTSTSSKPTTTSTSEARSSAASTSELPTTTANTSAAPSTTTEAGSGSGSGSTSGSNWADLNQVMLAMGRLATVAHGAE